MRWPFDRNSTSGNRNSDMSGKGPGPEIFYCQAHESKMSKERYNYINVGQEHEVNKVAYK